MIRAAALSHLGQRRTHNGDRYSLDSDRQTYIVADGLGGQAKGYVAADLTVSTIEEFLQLTYNPSELTWPFGYEIELPFEHNVLRTAMRLANLRVYQRAARVDSYLGMGSTVLVAWVRESTAYFSHVGDSRFYLMRQGALRRLTEDHTLIQMQLKQGIISPQEAKTHALRHVVTRAIGSSQPLDATIQELALKPKDRLLLCSDGLTDQLEDEALSELLGQPGDGLEAIGRQLLDRANGSGGTDNITVILIDFV